MLTLNRGAASELAQNGAAGIVADHWTDLITPARKAHQWSAEACRASVAHLTDDAMVEAYVDLYERLMDRGYGSDPYRPGSSFASIRT